ncbi:MAG: tyrosine-type recombinase/integrase [Bacilli bacterium]|nr:tyrosine-type recombinase/integrase [Bacilli bacterium]
MKLEDDIREYTTILALRSKSSKTIKTYKRILNDYLEYCQINHIEQQTKETILEYKQYLEDPDRQLSSNTLKLIYSCLRQFYKSMAMIGRCDHIALFLESSDRGEDTEFTKGFLTLPQVKALIKYVTRRASRKNHTVSDIRNKAIVWLMLTTGVRCIEVERANKKDIRVMDEDKGVVILSVQGKGKKKKSQFVMLEHHTYEAIQEYLSLRKDDKPALFLSHPNNSMTRVNRISSPIVSITIKNLLRAIDIDQPDITAHSLRHTTAMMSIDELGLNLDKVQQTLRHSDPKVTMIYAKTGSRISSGVEEHLGDLYSSERK